jgi:hypothetical protein
MEAEISRWHLMQQLSKLPSSRYDEEGIECGTLYSTAQYNNSAEEHGSPKFEIGRAYIRMVSCSPYIETYQPA